LLQVIVLTITVVWEAHLKSSAISSA